VEGEEAEEISDKKGKKMNQIEGSSSEGK